MKQSGIWTFFIQRPAISWLVLIAIIISGAFSIHSIPRELQPEINIPTALVSVALPGANPSDVETLLTDPLEKEIATISDIRNLTSTSSLSLANIIVEFEASADLQEKVQELKDKVDIAKTSLPDDATKPTITKFEANSDAIITFSLIGDLPNTELITAAETLQEQLEKIRGVSEARIIGAQTESIEISVIPEKIEQYPLSLSQISNTIRSENTNLPIGVINADQTKYSVRIDNRLTSISDFQNIPVHTTNDGVQIYLKDIADITRMYKEQTVISRLSTNGSPSQEAISLQIYKESGANIIEIADKTKTSIIEETRKISPNLQIAVTNDNSSFIKRDLGTLTRNGIQTTFIIILILFLALGLVEGILAGLSIPITLLATITIMNIQGQTINGLTLFALVIALGLMVDTAIVIMEGIHENIKNGQKPSEAALNSVKKYKAPLIAGTLTTVFAFFPMLLVSGILGEFLKALPITISAALISSIILSLTIIPAITSRFIKNTPDKTSLLEPFFHWLGNKFQTIINYLLHSRFRRVTTIITAIVIFAISMSIPATGMLTVEMFPQTDVPTFIINIETPKGKTVTDTEKIVAEIEEELYQISEIESFLSIIGTGESLTPTDLISVGGSSSSNKANITVNLTPAEERTLRSYDVADLVRKKIKNNIRAKITVSELTEGPPSDAPVALRIIGDDIETLNQISQDVQDIIAQVPNTININDDLEDGLTEFRYTLDREKLNQHALSSIQVAAEIRNIIQGSEIMEAKIDNEDLKVNISYKLPKPNNTTQINIQEIENLQVLSPKGYRVSLGQIADFQIAEGLTAINHDDQKRIIKVRSDLSNNASAVTATEEIQTQLKDYPLPSGYSIEFGGDTEDIEQSLTELFTSMSIAVILIAFTLVLMFNSLKQPFIILLTLPLALIGVFPGLLLIGLQLSFPAFLGIVALTGIVVNDAIVLIDQANINKQSGMTLKQSASSAAQSRLQPIIMTTITTVAGILPLALTDEFWSGLGFSLIFGLIAATGLTLIIMPVLYYMFGKEG